MRTNAARHRQKQTSLQDMCLKLAVLPGTTKAALRTLIQLLTSSPDFVFQEAGEQNSCLCIYSKSMSASQLLNIIMVVSSHSIPGCLFSNLKEAIPTEFLLGELGIWRC